MKIFSFTLLLLCSSLLLSATNGQSVKRSQQRQERIIKSAYKRGKVSDREFEKLMAEQKTIKRYIYLADKDHIWSAAEMNRVNGKLERAEERLKRYKTNGEY